MAAIVGHNYSPWIGFKGGKGIATTGGVLIGLMPFGAVMLILIWAVVTLTTRYVSVGSIVAAIALPVMTHLGARYHHLDNDKANPTLWEAGTWNKPLFALTLVAGILAVWRHRSNIQRLRNGTESRLFSKKENSS
jgi:glycerol-3-phosphate acyltransferase PlsY